MTFTLSAFALYARSAMLLGCLSGQVLHGYLRIMHSNPRSRGLVLLYEGALFVHIALMAVLSILTLRAESGVNPTTFLEVAPLTVFLWLNAAIAIAIGYAALSDIDDTGESDDIFWMLPIEVLITCLCTPSALSLLGELRFAVLTIDAAYFTFRTVFLLIRDHKNARKIVSLLSLNDALKRLPEGVLYVSEAGRTVFINDTMRHLLSSLHIPTSISNANELWSLLNERAAEPTMTVSASRATRETGPWVILRISNRETRLFSFDGAGFGNDNRYSLERPLDQPLPPDSTARTISNPARHTRVIAYDVTEEIKAIENIENTNEELAASQQELMASVEATREAAENEAMARMRGRVHDVIGQRLSLIHRALEDDAISDEDLAHLKPLIMGIMDDLTAGTRIDPADDLAATIDTFALSGVSVHVTGKLPGNETYAKLFTDCIREAATNAVKHARARNVNVRIDDSSLDVENDGMSPTWPITEGTGLTNMRHAVEAAGGEFEITPSPFTLHILIRS